MLLLGAAAMDSSLSGFLKIEHIAGKSVATRVFAKYPLKFLIPLKAAPSTFDAIWIYAISYGGGYVSGDAISCQVDVGRSCTMVLTTQASTKVYKSVEGKFSEQSLQMQLDQGAVQDVNTRLKGCHVVAMLVLYGPQLSDMSKQVQRKVKLLAGDTLKIGIRRRRDGTREPSNLEYSCQFFASCSTFGPFDRGILVRIAATKTEQVYEFLKETLTALVPLVGIVPYAGK